MQSLAGSKLHCATFFRAHPLCYDQRWLRPGLSRINASPVRCSDTTAPQPQDIRKPSEFKRGLVVPNRLLPSGIASLDSGKEHTVYTLRFRTAYGRGCGLDVPGSGIQVCLVGADGHAILRRVVPVYDPVTAEQEALEICKVADKEAGADCKRILKAAATSRSTSAALKQRFQEGSIDEISFLGPELGPLASLMVAPEEGSWRVDEVTVSSSRSRHTDRFVCRDALGTVGQSAGYLSPLPQDAVVYGSGESAVILTREQAAALHAVGMLDYCQLKDRILIATAALVAAGSSLCYAMAGWEATEPFLAGGIAALAYQRMLQANVDNLGSTQYPKAQLPRPAQALYRVIGNPSVRLSAALVLALVAVWGMHASNSSQDVDLSSMLEMRQVLTGILGFMTYKMALVGVAAVPSSPTQRATEGNRLL